MKYFACVAFQLQIKRLLALFIFESFTQELAFHLNVVFQIRLALSKVTQMCVGKFPLFFPHVAIAQCYACVNIQT